MEVQIYSYKYKQNSRSCCPFKTVRLQYVDHDLCHDHLNIKSNLITIYMLKYP